MGCLKLSNILAQRDQKNFHLFLEKGLEELSGAQKNRFNSSTYGFQGQETDQEMHGGAVSFKYRVHDARLGRFLSVDPLASSFAFNSSYSFAMNMVIQFIEREGAEISPTPISIGLENTRLDNSNVETINTSVLDRQMAVMKIKVPTIELFSQANVNKVFEYSIPNALLPKAEKDPCLACMNNSIKILLDQPDLDLNSGNGGNTYTTNDALQKKGLIAGDTVNINWEDQYGNSVVNTELEPDSPESSPGFEMLLMSKITPGIHVFTLGILDANHSVTVILDINENRDFKFILVDQNYSKDGNDWATQGKKDLDLAGVDAFIKERTVTLWNHNVDIGNGHRKSTTAITKLKTAPDED